MDSGVFIAQRVDNDSSIARICCQSEVDCSHRGSAEDLHLELEDLHLSTVAGTSTAYVFGISCARTHSLIYVVCTLGCACVVSGGAMLSVQSFRVYFAEFDR